MNSSDICKYVVGVMTSYFLFSDAWIVYDNKDTRGPLLFSTGGKLDIDLRSVECQILIGVIGATFGSNLIRQLLGLVIVQTLMSALIISHVSTASYGPTFVHALMYLAFAVIHNYYVVDNFDNFNSMNVCCPANKICDFVPKRAQIVNFDPYTSINDGLEYPERSCSYAMYVNKSPVEQQFQPEQHVQEAAKPSENDEPIIEPTQ